MRIVLVLESWHVMPSLQVRMIERLYCHRVIDIANRQHQHDKELRLLTRADVLVSDDDAPADCLS